MGFIAGFVGFSEGVVVGGALVAFITLLDIVPRLAQLSSSEELINLYEKVIIISATGISLFGFIDRSISITGFLVVLIGFLMGVFVGLLAAALAEVTNVIPVMVNRFHIQQYVKYIFFSLVSGKVVGSLIYWMVLNK